MQIRFSKLASIMAIVSILGMVVIPVAGQSAAPTDYNPDACASDNAGQPLSADCQAMIAAFPRPQVTAIEQDKLTLSAYSFWRVGPDAINTYDQPNGQVVGQIPKGFNFVRAIDLNNA